MNQLEGNFVEPPKTEEIIGIVYLDDDKESPFYANVDDSYYRDFLILEDNYIAVP
ncbi:hypothetical protein [Anaerovirgula multivorans]|uniref:hypothetical protein n=1 Tax=Anaerovirgula multivorans TaxID=312168 RepID=UPI001594EE53|nr:hypothetical protein [Anaerovirgula multivorans]